MFLSHFQKSKVGALCSALGANPRVHRPPAWDLPPSSSALPQGYPQPVPTSVLSEMGTQVIFLRVEVFSLRIHTLFFDIIPNSDSNFSPNLSQLLSVHVPGPPVGEIKIDAKDIAVNLYLRTE